MSHEGLIVRGLSVARAGREVVRAVDLDVLPGRITALLGPNGAGKSSLVLALAGVLPLLAGTVQCGGTDITGRRPESVRRSGLAIAPEGHRVLAELTVSDNLRVAASSLPRGKWNEERDRIFSWFPELTGLMNQQAGSLSGGQQQMLALAQTLVGTPRVVVIDELSLGLAPIVVSRLLPTLKDVAASGIGILLIEQFTTVALDLAQDALVMVSGVIRLRETTEVLQADPSLIQVAYHLGSGETKLRN